MPSLTFTVADAFIITGRGLVLAGVASDNFHVGDRIIIALNGKTINREITGIDGMRHSKVPDMLGILIKCENEEEQKYIRFADISGKQFQILTNQP